MLSPNKTVGLSDLQANATGVQPPFDNTISDKQLAILEPALEKSDLGLLRTGASGAPADGSTAGDLLDLAARHECNQ
jgi:hypothetical protein